MPQSEKKEAILTINEAECPCETEGKAEKATEYILLTSPCKTEECKFEKRKYRNWTLWVSISGLCGMILHSSGLLKKFGLDSEELSLLIMIISTILTAFGIIKKPDKQ